jgi:hypothetical protein
MADPELWTSNFGNRVSGSLPQKHISSPGIDADTRSQVGEQDRKLAKQGNPCLGFPASC